MADSLDTDFALLKRTAAEAARLALRYWRKPLTVRRKSDGSPVTEADMAVDALLQDRLRGARPVYGWLSEESAEHVERLTRARVWAADPIDGTRAFVQGKEDWTVALALLDNGFPVLAVVVNPVREEFFEARAGMGAFLNGKGIRASSAAMLGGARIVASDGMLTKAIWREPWPELTPVWANSLAYRMALVADGRFDAAFAMTPRSEWDIAAGALLVIEAGGQVTSPTGAALKFNTPDAKVDGFIAAGTAMHGLLAERMSEAYQTLHPAPTERPV